MTTTTYTAQQVLNASAQGLDLGAAAILDSSATVIADLDQLEPLTAAGKIGSIAFTDQSAPAITLSGAQAVSDLQVLSLFSGSYTLSVGATAAQAEQLAAIPHISIGVSDIPSVILANLDALQAIAGSLTEIDIPPAGIQPETTMTFSQAQLAEDSAAMAKIVAIPRDGLSTTGVILSVSGSFTVAQAVAAEQLNGYIQKLTVVDSLANLEAAINTAPSRPGIEQATVPGLSPATFNFTSITLTDSGTPIIVMPFNDGTATGSISENNAEGFLAAITNQHSIHWTDVPVGEVSALLDSGAVSQSQPGTLVGTEVSIQDSAANVAGVIDYLQAYALKGEIASITITDGLLPTFTSAQSQVDAGVIAQITVTNLTAAMAVANTSQIEALAGITVRDSAANVAISLDGLETLASAGKLSGITLTDSAIPVLTVSAAQETSDAAALAEIKGTYQLDVTATTSATIKGVSGIATTVAFSGNEATYSFTAAGNGSDLTVTDGSGTAYHVSGVQALAFADNTAIVAATPGPASAVTTGNLAELYGAVFGREPDVPGLAFYQAYMTTTPSTSLLQYAEFFLNSLEYKNNSAHAYPQTVAGDQLFITDSYQNLLHRTPTSSEVSFYEDNVIAPALQNLQAGTTAYAAADLAAHALTLVYFSNSAEFLGDVKVTAQNPASASHWLILV